MQEQSPQPMEWKKGQNDLEFFGQLDTPSMLEWIRENPDEAIYYVKNVLYAQECNKYRGGEGVRPEAKILFTVGGLELVDLSCVKDFAGNKVRTKKKEQYWKAPELHELIGLASIYIEQNVTPGIDMEEAEVFAEIVDIFYNLIHLQLTDPEESERWERWVEHFREAVGIDLLPIIEMLVAKYHTRMFANGGKNDFELEDSLILEILKREFDEKNIDFKDMFTKILNLGHLINRVDFTNRMRELKDQYRAETKVKEENNEENNEEIEHWLAAQTLSFISEWLLKQNETVDKAKKLKEEQEEDLQQKIRDVLTGDIRR